MIAAPRALPVALLVAALAVPARAADLDEVRARGTLVHLGIPYAEFVTGAGDGMDVELVQGFAKALDVEYAYAATDWGTVVPDLVGRKVSVQGANVTFLDPVTVRGDLVANGFTVLPWRRNAVDFSRPTFPSQIWLVARADAKVSPIVPTGDIAQDVAATRALMRGKKVLTLAKTCLDPNLYDLAGGGAAVVAFQGKLNEVAPALLNGDAELTILDVPDALVALRKWRGKLKILGPISDRQSMGAAFPKGSPRLREAFDAYLQRIQHDGTYLALVRKYYPAVEGYFPEFFAGME